MYSLFFLFHWPKRGLKVLWIELLFSHHLFAFLLKLHQQTPIRADTHTNSCIDEYPI